MKSPSYVPEYEHLRCDCGGIIQIGGYHSSYNPICNDCGKLFTLHKLNYDRLLINDKTGWIFPVVDKKGENYELLPCRQDS